MPLGAGRCSIKAGWPPYCVIGVQPPSAPTPNAMGGQPTHRSHVEEKANAYVHPEVPTGILT